MGLYERWAGQDPEAVKIAVLYMHSNYREVLTARMNVSSIKTLHVMDAEDQTELENAWPLLLSRYPLKQTC